jgi:hypothetical protein
VYCPAQRFWSVQIFPVFVAAQAASPGALQILLLPIQRVFDLRFTILELTPGLKIQTWSTQIVLSNPYFTLPAVVVAGCSADLPIVCLSR